MDRLIVHALGITTGDAPQTSHRCFAHLHHMGGQSDATPFNEMSDDLDRLGLRPLVLHKALLRHGAMSRTQYLGKPSRILSRIGCYRRIGRTGCLEPLHHLG